MQISMFPPVQRMLMLLVEWVKRLVACACVPGLSSHSLTTRQDRRFVDFCKFNIKMLPTCTLYVIDLAEHCCYPASAKTGHGSFTTTQLPHLVSPLC
jgi:hypothetical protein